MVYLQALRRLRETRGAAVLRDLEQFTESVRSWRETFQEFGHREWRQQAVSVDRVLEVLMGSGELRERLATSREMRRMLQEEKELVSREPGAFAPEIANRAAELETALDRLDADLTDYESVLADAVFACNRFPLSLIAAVVGLGTAPVLTWGRGQRQGH